MPISPQAHANAYCARSVADALAFGCGPSAPRQVFVSPGSRSTPLVLALAAHPDVQLHVVLDERAAAFAALGVAHATGRAACTLCTSGSAAAHALPAAIEAYHAGIALLMMTADRPLEAQGIGAPQTTWQPSIYSAHTRADFMLPAPVAAHDSHGPNSAAQQVAAQWRSVMARALATAESIRPGPVHVNLPFREPLGTVALPHNDADKPAPLHVAYADIGRPPRAGLEALCAFVARAQRGAIVCGPAAPAPQARAPQAAAVWALARATGWPVFCEASANLGPAPNDVHCMVAADALALAGGGQRLPRADAWLHLGLAPAGRGLARLVTDQRAAHASIYAPGCFVDAAHQSDLVCEGDVAAWLTALAKRAAPASHAQRAFTMAWQMHNDAACRVLQHEYASTSAWHEATALWAVCANRSAGDKLVVGNSLSVRDLDTFAVQATTGHTALVTMARRGVSGIEGALAHLMGVAMASPPSSVIGLLGDLTFLHDVQSLRLLVQAQRHVRLFVFDNGGGEIFAQLPIAQNESMFTRYFQTPQIADARALCEAQGAAFISVSTLSELTAYLTAPTARNAGAEVVWLRFGPAARQARQALLDAVGRRQLA